MAPRSVGHSDALRAVQSAVQLVAWKGVWTDEQSVVRTDVHSVANSVDA